MPLLSRTAGRFVQGHPRPLLRAEAAGRFRVGVGGVATGALVLFELRRRGMHEANGLKGLAGGVRDLF